MAGKAKLIVDGKEYEFPIVIGTEGEKAIDISALRSATGYITLDSGYKNTGETESAITYLDGEDGILRIRSRAAGNANGSGDACTAFATGETEDYYIYIDTLVSGLPELAWNGLSVYPNPTREIVQIDFGKYVREKVTVSVFSLLGAEVHSLTLSGVQQTRCDLSGLPDGMYLVRISTVSASTVRKVVLRRD